MKQDGLLVVNKETGWTSHDVVAKCRRLLGIKKIGHTGTLDPMATGVLPVAVGKATKLSDLISEGEKVYEAVLRLGLKTDTQDVTGQVLSQREVSCSEAEIRAAAESFLGDQLQVPPMYSARKVQGRKLYELARKGQVVEREARPVRFEEIEVTAVQTDRVWLRVRCSKGTYIRTLCHDIGERLGCGACMESLCRTMSGGFTLKEAVTLPVLEQALAEKRGEEYLLSLDQILASYPVAFCPPQEDRLLYNGNPVHAFLPSGQPQGSLCLTPGCLVRMYDSKGVICALYRAADQGPLFRPEKMFL